MGLSYARKPYERKARRNKLMWKVQKVRAQQFVEENPHLSDNHLFGVHISGPLSIHRPGVLEEKFGVTKKIMEGGA